MLVSMKTRPMLLAVLCLAATTVRSEDAAAPRGETPVIRKIWDQAPHNAFTSLVRFRGRWLCTFREGAKHVSPDGAIRVIASTDGTAWESISHVTSPTADLRDPKLSVTPDGRLMMVAAGAAPANSQGVTHHSLAFFSDDGRTWTDPIEIGQPNDWLWRVTWHEGKAYAVGYSTSNKSRVARLYASDNGKSFKPIVPVLHQEGYPNEASLLFDTDDSALCLLRRDGTPSSGLLGRSKPPYASWEWLDLGVRIGGPHLIRLSDGRLCAGVRLYDGKQRMALGWIDADKGTFTEWMALPSGGDCSYPGLVEHEGRLWVSYYSSHEGKTSIYLAQVPIPAVSPSR